MIYPWGCKEDRKSVQIDPRVRFGQPIPPVISIPVLVIQERILQAKEGIQQVSPLTAASQK